MVPIITLITITLAARTTGWAGLDALDDWQTALRAGLAAMFLLTGAVHFAPGFKDDMAAMIPPALPRPALLVALTGILELAGAAGLLIPATATTAAICLALLLAAMFPANISAARRGITFRGEAPTPIVRRTLEQALFITAAVLAAL